MNVKLILLIIAIITTHVISAQSFKVEGKIIESGNSNSIPGSYVFVNNTSFGTRTDALGYFMLANLPAGKVELRVTNEGFSSYSTTLDLTSDIVLNIELKENISDLPQLVVESQSLSLGRLGMKEIPGSVQYVSTAELKKYNFTNVNDVLKMVPGVNVQEEDGFGLRPNIGLRGSGLDRSARITLMEDGILAAPAPYASPSAYYFPTMGRMSGMEVMKGASQIRFGPFTTGGAINFISTPIPNNFSSKFQMSTGSFGFKNLHVNAGNSFERIGFLVETFQYGADGFKTLPSGDNTGFDKKDYQVKLRFNTKPAADIYQSLNLTLGQTFENSNETYLGLSDSDFNEDPYQRYAASQVDNMDAEQSRISLQHYIEIPKLFNVLTTVYRNDFARNWYKLQSIAGGPSITSVLDDPTSNMRAYNLLNGISDSDSVSLNVRANNREYYAQGIQTVFDFEFETGNVAHDIHVSARIHEDQEDRFQWEDGYAMNGGVMKLINPGAPGTQANRIETAKAFASYVFYKLTLNRLSLTPGLRYENVTVSRRDFGRNDVTRSGSALTKRKNEFNAWLPGVGANYTLSKQYIVFGGVHRGFAPAGSAPETKPELSTNFELGARKMNSNIEGSFVFFYNDYERLLGQDAAASGGIGTGDQFNAGSALAVGIELQVGFDALKNRKDSKISMPITMSYTFTDAYFTESFESDFGPWGFVNKDDKLPYIANHQVYINLGLEHKRANLFVTSKYQSEINTVPGSDQILATELIDGFMTFDLSSNFFLNKYFSFNLSINNLFDNKYAVAARPTGLRPGMPRFTSLGVKMFF